MAKSITLNALFKTLMNIVNICFPLLTAPYVARVLSIDGFTEYNRAVSMITWFSPFAVFGVYTYGMRTISQIKKDKVAVSELFTKLFIINFISSFVVFLIYNLLVISLPSFKRYRDIYLVISMQLLATFFATDWINEAFEEYGFILFKTFICRCLYIAAVFIFVKKQSDVSIYVLLTSLSLVINNLFTFLYAKSKICFTRVNISKILVLIPKLFVVFLLVNSSMLYTILDRFCLTCFSNKLNITYYTISQTIILAIVNVTSSLLLVTIPRLSFYWGNNNLSEYNFLLRDSIDTFMLLHTPSCIGLSCIAYEVMYFYSGINYIGGYTTLLLFSLRYYVSAFDMILSKQVLLATNNERILTKIYYSGGVLNIGLKVFLYYTGNLTPELCVVTTMFADIIIIIYQIVEIKHLKLEVKIFSMNLLKYLFTSLLFIPITLIVRKCCPTAIIFRTIISIFLCFLIYLFMIIISKDKSYIKIKTKITKRINRHEIN